MNYWALTRVYSVPTRKPTAREKRRIIFDFLKGMFSFFITLPLLVLGKLGIMDEIPSFFSGSLGLCSICFCGALVGMSVSVGIGVGIGVGVGLNCAKSNPGVFDNATSNFSASFGNRSSMVFSNAKQLF